MTEARMKTNERDELARMGERKIASEEIFQGFILHVQKDTVGLPDGNTASREVIRHIGAVCVIPVTEDNQVIMERQYRYPIDRVIWEIPAGKLDAADEKWLDAAKRELREETGYTADEWTMIGEFYGAPAYSDERIGMFLARGLHRGERHLDADEYLDVVKVPLKDLVADVMNGVISDAKTQVAILKAARLLGI